MICCCCFVGREAGYALLEMARSFRSPWIPSYGQDVQSVFCRTASKGKCWTREQCTLHYCSVWLLLLLFFCSYFDLRSTWIKLQLLTNTWKFWNSLIITVWFSTLCVLFLVTITIKTMFLTRFNASIVVCTPYAYENPLHFIGAHIMHYMLYGYTKILRAGMVWYGTTRSGVCYDNYTTAICQRLQRFIY